MSKPTKEELEALRKSLMSSYDFDEYEEENPPEKLNVPRLKWDPDKSFPDYWEYYKPYALVLFIKKATEALKATGSLDEMKDKKYNFYPLAIEVEVEGKYQAYEEVFEYDFTSEAEELIKKYS